MNIFDFDIVETLKTGQISKISVIKKTGGAHNETLYVGKLCEKLGWTCDYNDILLAEFYYEKKILEEVTGGPFIIKLVDVYENTMQILLVLEYLPVRDLDAVLSIRKLSEDEVKSYAAEIVVALEYLHGLNIIHRDIKPANIGLDKEGHITIIDFDLSKKIVSSENNKASTYCGTKKFMAPEMIAGQEYDESVDWWSFGVTLFRLLTKAYPFDDEHHDTPNFPEYISPITKDFLSKLLIKQPDSRLGGGGRGAKDVKDHPFFSAMDWGKVSSRQMEPPDLYWFKSLQASSAQRQMHHEEEGGIGMQYSKKTVP